MGFLWATGPRLSLIITICCLQAFILYGYDQGVFGGLLENPLWKDQFGYPGDILTGIIIGSYTLGALAGCVANFFVAEWLGRRRTIWIAMAWISVGAALQASAFTLGHLFVGRVVTGIGTGMKTSTVPMYQAELCDREKRGRLVSAEVFFVGIGICIAYWLDFGLSYAPGSISWRFPLAFQIVFALLVVVIVFGVPESPRWLCKQGRKAEAWDVLMAIQGPNGSEEYAKAELSAIEDALAVEHREEDSQSFWSMFRADDLRTRYRVGLAWGVQTMNQLGGINLLVYYAPTILVTNVQMSAKLAQIVGGCINLCFPIGSVLPSLMLDRMGRRKTMMWGSLALGISMALVAGLLSQGDPITEKGQKFASSSIAFLFTYMLAFGATMNCAPWVYVSEILPLKARTRGTAIGISANWTWNFFIVMISPVITQRLGWRTYIIFAVLNIFFIIPIYFLYPETSNVSLEDVDHFFLGGGNPVKKAREIQREMKAGRIERGQAGVVRSLSMDLGEPNEKEKNGYSGVLERVSS